MPGPFDELEKEAEQIEKKSKEEFAEKNFVSAISFLEEAKEIYRKLGFQGKISMIDQRISRLKNLVQHETRDSFAKTKGETEFQERVDKVLKEKEMYMEKKLSEQKTVPPEMKSKLEKVAMMLEKAEKEEKLGKFSRVIGRYEYILEIYKAIPKDIFNLSNEIYEIEKKLSILKTQ
ncbi:MAG: hypothetical protein ACFE8B_08035 [Candidatus Hermodarchaeota archaeon]